jgi:hypothetical protein
VVLLLVPKKAEIDCALAAPKRNIARRTYCRYFAWQTTRRGTTVGDFSLPSVGKGPAHIAWARAYLRNDCFMKEGGTPWHCDPSASLDGESRRT